MALCFSNYATEIKVALKETTANEDVVELLFNAVIFPTELTNKKGDPYTIDKGDVSKLFNRHANIPRKIREASVASEVVSSINDYFEKSVVKSLLPGLENELVHKLSELIRDDNTIPNDTKNELLAKADKDKIAEFLAAVFLYTIKRDNNISDKKPKAAHAGEDNSENVTEPTPDLESIENRRSTPLPALDPPEKIDTQEIPYVRELMAAYGDAERDKSFSQDLLKQFPKYQENFHRQRKDYYAAESVRRGTRDIYSDTDPDQFEVLKEETYDGVVDVLEQKFQHGYARLSRVMAQAAQIRVDRCWLSRHTDWIGNSQKKGVCHVLVNDGRIKGWVSSDD